MFQYFETIKYQNGEFFLLDYHEERMNRTRREALGENQAISLLANIKLTPEDDQVYRCKVRYKKNIQTVDYFPYSLAAHKTMEIKDAGNYDYNYKSTDRKFLLDAVAESEQDEVLFVKNGFVTDTSYCNVVLHDGHQWVTPSTYLLKGVKRSFLLDKGLIKEKEIRVEDLPHFSKIALINAMRDFEMVYSFQIDNDVIKLTEL
ncbi:MAG: aminotransferase class IV [Cytophagales bacterium]|nr:aminotransferase class IV [Cytophagales bacterium]